MRKLLFVLFVPFLFLISCKTESTNSTIQEIEDNTLGVKVELVIRAGDKINDYNFVAVPFNIAKNVDHTANDSLYIIISHRIDADNTKVIPFAKITLSDEGHDLCYIVSTPSSDANLEFTDLITEYSSTKWIIEYYLSNYKGLGKIKFDKWEPYSLPE
jgi:hypothetical protein